MLELLRRRRSIRKYQEIPLKPEEVENLKEILLRSPSAHNDQSWEFIFIDDPVLLRQLSEVRAGSSAFLAGAALGIVILGNEKTKDVWVEDASVAATMGQITAASMGIGSCWIQIRNRDHAPDFTAEDYVRRILAIPAEFRVLSILAMGYPAEKKTGIPNDELRREKIHLNGF